MKQSDVLVEDFDNFKRMVVENGKTETAKYYGVTRSTVAYACKRYGIEVKPYHGKRSIKFDVETVLKEHGDKTPAEIARILGVPAHQIMRKIGDKLTNQFSRWEEERIRIEQDIERYRDIHYNQKKTLLQISKEEGISYTTLKNTFAKFAIPVRLYSHNKSNGELEILEYLKELFGEAYSVRIASGVFNQKGMEIDCLAPTVGLGVEYCGEFWHSAERMSFIDYHQRKEQICRNFQVSLITIFDSEYHRSPESFKRYIRGVCFGGHESSEADGFSESCKERYMDYHFIEPKDGLIYSENSDCIIAHDTNTIFGVAPKTRSIFSVERFLKETGIKRAELDNRSVDRIWFLGFEETLTPPRPIFYDKKQRKLSNDGILIYDCGVSILIM